jgi:hypothetical protein
MKKSFLLVAAAMIILSAIVARGSGAGLAGPTFCVDQHPVTFDQYGYYDGRTVSQMFSIVLHGDPNGAVVNGKWVQQLPPGVFADYVGPAPMVPGAYVFHGVGLAPFGYCRLVGLLPPGY